MIISSQNEDHMKNLMMFSDELMGDVAVYENKFFTGTIIGDSGELEYVDGSFVSFVDYAKRVLQ